VRNISEDETFRLCTPCGPLQVWLNRQAVTALAWRPGAEPEPGRPPTALGRRVWRALQAYFEAPGGSGFDFPLQLTGTPFQHRVWGALLAIPAGQVRTYGALAAQLQTSPRAVAAACRANPCPLVVPCHRVVAAGGLGGYCGASTGPQLGIKRWLLTHEGWHG